ncbi:IS5/IS1182 family transposase, partial [Staphylococcus aureus]|nr:IS5/IS1182 family transposase [Staphylococcus aureus]MBO8489207.1 IS5/IS1182 family transposase [Staphylococcus aureus]
RELGFVLMALNIRKVVAQRAENNQKIYKKDNFYIISIEIVFFSLIQELYVPDSCLFNIIRKFLFLYY